MARNEPEHSFMVVESYTHFVNSTHIMANNVVMTIGKDEVYNNLSKSYRKHFHAKEQFDREVLYANKYLNGIDGSIQLVMLKVENGALTTTVIEKEEWGVS
jgi:hypothetical protein